MHFLGRGGTWIEPPLRLEPCETVISLRILGRLIPAVLTLLLFAAAPMGRDVGAPSGSIARSIDKPVSSHKLGDRARSERDAATVAAYLEVDDDSEQHVRSMARAGGFVVTPPVTAASTCSALSRGAAGLPRLRLAFDRTSSSRLKTERAPLRAASACPPSAGAQSHA